MSRSRKGLHIALRLLVLAWASSGALASTPLPDAKPLLSPHPLQAFHLNIESNFLDAGKFQIDPIEGPGFTHAWSIATKRDVDRPEAIQLRAVIPQEISRGEVGFIRLFARASSSPAQLGLIVRTVGFEPRPSFAEEFSIPIEWKEVLVPFRMNRDSSPGQAEIILQFGFKRQEIAIGGFELLYFGKIRNLGSLPRTSSSYPGREAGALWRELALARIERLRKSDFEITVLDRSGSSIPNAIIRIEQRRSAFHWGSALEMRRIIDDSPENGVYKQRALELFNSATTENDLKWPEWSGEKAPRFAREQTLQGLSWLNQRGLYVRGHVLVWPSWKYIPKTVQDLRGTPREMEIPTIVQKHIKEITHATRGLVQEWDVVNEPFSNHDLMDMFGDQLMTSWFRAAREVLPDAPLYLNDYDNHDAVAHAEHVDHFETTARYLLQEGAPLTGLGIQAHFGARPSSPEVILAVLDRYREQFDLPIRITEFDVNTFDEELQADFTRDFFILCFSHPAIVGVHLWGFWEKAHWQPAAAMYREDWTAKPNAQVYRSLVLDTWRTRLDATTDEKGQYHGRGFHGDYVVIFDRGGTRTEQAFSILPGQAARVIIQIH